LLGISVSLFCLLAFVQLTGANPFMLFPQGLNFYGAGIYYLGEFIATLGNTGMVGSFLSLVAGVFSMALIKVDFKQKWISQVPFFLLIVLIFKLNIEAAILALMVGLVFMLPVAITNTENLSQTLLMLAIVISAVAISQVIDFGDGLINLVPRNLILLIPAVCAIFLAKIVARAKDFTKISKKQYRFGTITAVLLATCGVMIYLYFFGYQHNGMIYEASQILRGRWDDSFGSSRVYIWRSVLEAIELQNLLFGTGPDTLGYWQIESFTRYSEEFGVMWVTNIDAAHNEYIHILATLGLFAFISYIGALIFMIIKWFRFPDNKLSAVSGAGVLFYSIQAFFGISMPIVAPFFWVCVAILVNSHDNEEKTQKTI